MLARYPLRKRTTKEFGLRSRGFVIYDLDPDRSCRGNHSSGTDLSFFLFFSIQSVADRVRGTPMMCTPYVQRNTVVALVREDKTGFVENCASEGQHGRATTPSSDEAYI